MSYKLHYFNMRARAELARLVFAYAGVDYDDVRVSYEGDDKIGDWSDIKARKIRISYQLHYISRLFSI